MFARELTPILGPGAALAIVGSVSPTFTAAGTTQGTATSITTSVTNITAGGDATGAVLPQAMTVGDSGMVCNATSTTKYVYPTSGGTINGGTANVPLALAPNTSMRFAYVTVSNVVASV